MQFALFVIAKYIKIICLRASTDRFLSEYFFLFVLEQLTSRFEFINFHQVTEFQFHQAYVYTYKYLLNFIIRFLGIVSC